MMKTTIRLVAGVLAVAWGVATAQELADISLPPPKTEGGKPLRDALKARASTREFGTQPIEPQTLSDLLWAAQGITRADGKRTSPSAKDWREIEIYVLNAEGAYRHDVRANRLQAVAKGDLRGLTGKQEFVTQVPVNLVYVADTTKMQKASAEEVVFYSAVDAGFVSQNIYLFCASEGLATVVRMPGDTSALAAALNLPDTSKIILAQSVGWSKK